MPLAQFAKSTACIPSTLISKTRFMWPSWWKSLSWAVALPTEQAAARESKASVFFIVTSSHDGMERHVNGVLRRVKQFVKNYLGMWKFRFQVARVSWREAVNLLAQAFEVSAYEYGTGVFSSFSISLAGDFWKDLLSPRKMERRPCRKGLHCRIQGWEAEEQPRVSGYPVKP